MFGNLAETQWKLTGFLPLLAGRESVQPTIGSQALLSLVEFVVQKGWAEETGFDDAAGFSSQRPALFPNDRKRSDLAVARAPLPSGVQLLNMFTFVSMQGRRS